MVTRHASATVAGTNRAAARSASRSMCERCWSACSTLDTMRATMEESTGCVQRSSMVPSMTNEPALTRSPGARPAGTGSPVSMDSSIAEAPRSIVPSTGMRSPASTWTRSPAFTVAASTVHPRVVAAKAGQGGREFHQFTHRAAAAAPGVRFEQTARCYQQQHHAGRVEVDLPGTPDDRYGRE